MNDEVNDELSQAQCDEFRRHNGDFNSMVRAIFSAGRAQQQLQAEPSAWRTQAGGLVSAPFAGAEHYGWTPLYAAAPAQPPGFDRVLAASAYSAGLCTQALALIEKKDAEIAALKAILEELAALDFGANVITDDDEYRMDAISRRARAAMAQAVQP